MQLSNSALEILKNRKKLRLVAYQDSAGVWTIGYGATTYENGAKVKAGDIISEAKAQQLLTFHVSKAVGTINTGVSSKLTQGQFDALVSFAYNAGGPAFMQSTLRVLVNKNPDDLPVIEAEFRKWVYVTVKGQKVKSPGLINRREEEIAMYEASKKKLPGTGSVQLSFC